MHKKEWFIINIYQYINKCGLSAWNYLFKLIRKIFI